MSTRIAKLNRAWRASDGQIFEKREDAQSHQLRLNIKSMLEEYDHDADQLEVEFLALRAAELGNIYDEYFRIEVEEEK